MIHEASSSFEGSINDLYNLEVRVLVIIFLANA